MNITPFEIRELLDYNPEPGLFVWKERLIRPGHRTDKMWNADNANKQAGYVDAHGYVRITLTVKGQKHYIKAHRLVWFWVTGAWPPEDIDHINMDRSDNRIANLRLATRAENRTNTRAQSNSKSGIKGVSFDKVNNLWRVNITKDGKTKNLGRFLTLEEAVAVRQRHAIALFGEFVNKSSP